MTVLIVDDNDTNRKLCRVILEQSGYRVREAANGAEGLQFVRSEPPELILMDVQMPAMDGLEALKRLKIDPATRNIPVVALTSYAMKGDRERFLADGFSDYVSKPIDVDRFLEVVRHLAPLPPPSSPPQESGMDLKALSGKWGEGFPGPLAKSGQGGKRRVESEEGE